MKRPATLSCLLLALALTGSHGANARPGAAAPPLPRSLPAPAGRGLPALPAPAAANLPRIPGLPVARIAQSQALARQHPKLLETGPRGMLRVRGEVLAINPGDLALRRAVAAGFTARQEQSIEALGLRIVVLTPAPRTGTRAALRQLQRLDPDGAYAFNHIYLGSGSGARATRATPAPARSGTTLLRVGLVDGSVDTAHPSLDGVEVVAWGCGSRTRPSEHGTAVASLLAGSAGGEAAGGVLFAADIYCGQPTGGSVVALVQALAWMAKQKVGVINISLVGPDNPLLAQAVHRMSAQGHVIVSAVGNDGPRSPPLFPAAYPEVIGVTAVDEQGRLLPEAVRGPQARFAAPGARLMAARPGGEWQNVRGTSFAAPLVARLAARALHAPAPNATEHAVARLGMLARPARTPGIRLLPVGPTTAENPNGD